MARRRHHHNRDSPIPDRRRQQGGYPAWVARSPSSATTPAPVGRPELLRSEAWGRKRHRRCKPERWRGGRKPAWSGSSQSSATALSCSIEARTNEGPPDMHKPAYNEHHGAQTWNLGPMSTPLPCRINATVLQAHGLLGNRNGTPEQQQGIRLATHPTTDRSTKGLR